MPHLPFNSTSSSPSSSPSASPSPPSIVLHPASGILDRHNNGCPSNPIPGKTSQRELYKSSDAIEHIGVSSFVGDDCNEVGLPNPAVEDRPFIFIINFMLPGPPHHSLVLYFTPEDPSELKKNSVFADLCHDILRGPNDELRTRANSLALRSTQAALAAAKGAGFVAGHPAGRWCREALFFLVWSCPQSVVAANLCELAGLA